MKIKIVCLLMVLLLSGCGQTDSSFSSSSITSSSSNISSSSAEDILESQVADIFIISREYCHGWNDNDNGMFITSDGKIYKFDATGKSTDKGRFFTYEHLYDYLVETMKTSEPISVIDVTTMVDIANSLSLSEEDWTTEHWGNDIGQHDYKLVRSIDGKLVFDTLYTSGDSNSGYTKNKDVMKLVDDCSTILNKLRDIK